MIAEERFPVLSTGSLWANLPHILLNGPFTHWNIQLEKFPTDTLRSPESVVCCHLLDQGDRLGREPRLSRVRPRFVLPEYAEELTVPAKKRLWLDKEQRLFPGPNQPSEKHQEKAVRLPVDRSFDLSTKDD